MQKAWMQIVKIFGSKILGKFKERFGADVINQILFIEFEDKRQTGNRTMIEVNKTLGYQKLTCCGIKCNNYLYFAFIAEEFDAKRIIQNYAFS